MDAIPLIESPSNCKECLAACPFKKADCAYDLSQEVREVFKRLRAEGIPVEGEMGVVEGLKQRTRSCLQGIRGEVEERNARIELANDVALIQSHGPAAVWVDAGGASMEAAGDDVDRSEVAEATRDLPTDAFIQVAAEALAEMAYTDFTEAIQALGLDAERAHGHQEAIEALVATLKPAAEPVAPDAPVPVVQDARARNRGATDDALFVDEDGRQRLEALLAEEGVYSLTVPRIGLQSIEEKRESLWRPILSEEPFEGFVDAIARRHESDGSLCHVAIFYRGPRPDSGGRDLWKKRLQERKAAQGA